MAMPKLPSQKRAPGRVPPPPQEPTPSFLGNIFLPFVIIMVLAFGASALSDMRKAAPVPLSEVARAVRAGEVTSVKVVGSELSLSYKDGSTKTAQKEPEASLSSTLSAYGVSPEELGAVQVSVENPSGASAFLMNLAPLLIPVFLLVGLMWYLSRQVKTGGGMQALSFGQSKARVSYPDDSKQKVLFKDVAGVKEAKEELREIVDFLRSPKKFLDIGAQIPKGVLLMGPPGTGKTMLARAVAGEAGVPFFHLSGSEFVEMFVGVGASRVRDLFRQAKKEAPSIIFVDEIDAVGRVRGTGMGGGNDEREQTLNQILVEMDGFEPNEKVIVMAATNRPDVLDRALLRPGRFDRRVMLELPDLADREEILTAHAQKKPLAEDVRLRTIAERTPGFSGADLSSLMNEAAILAAREDRKKVAQFDLIRSIEKVMIGPERKSHMLSPQEKRITAYHEGGHALLSSLLPHADPVHKVSIISRGHAAGYTLKLPGEERRFRTRKEFFDDIVVALGGYVTEQMVFDDLTTGPSNDLSVASALARDMVMRYGMGTLGPVTFVSDTPRLEGGEPTYSDDVAARIDREVERIMHDALVLAQDLLAKHRHTLDVISEELVHVETIERAEFEALLRSCGIRMKERSGGAPYVAGSRPVEFTVPTPEDVLPDGEVPHEESVEPRPAPEPTRAHRAPRRIAITRVPHEENVSALETPKEDAPVEVEAPAPRRVVRRRAKKEERDFPPEFPEIG